MQHKELTEHVIGAAFEVWNELGFGFLEPVYEKSLLVALKDRAIAAVAQRPIKVMFRGVVVGEYVSDLLVEDRILVELKSAKQLAAAHEVQLVNYLTATKIDIGLLINFGPTGVEVKRKHRRPKN